MSAAAEATVLASRAAPEISDSDHFDDVVWFARHPRRLFRGRNAKGGTWLVRRQPQGGAPDAYLRVWSTDPPPPDEDEPLAAAWYRGACPDQSVPMARRWARKLIRGRQT